MLLRGVAPNLYQFILFCFRLVFVLKQEHERNSHNQSEACENEPGILPAARIDRHQIAVFIPSAEVVDNFASSECTDCCTQTVCHEHKQTLT